MERKRLSNKMNKSKDNLEKAINYIAKLLSSKKEKLMVILRKVKEVQSSDFTLYKNFSMIISPIRICLNLVSLKIREEI